MGQNEVLRAEQRHGLDLDASFLPTRHLPGAEPSAAMDERFLAGMPVDLVEPPGRTARILREAREPASEMLTPPTRRRGR